jgi:tetratricopeptide (TPR) repeat protein
LSTRPIADATKLASVLSCIDEALARQGWAEHHDDISLIGGALAVASRKAAVGRKLLRKAIEGGKLDAEKIGAARLSIGDSFAKEHRFDSAADAYRAVLDDERLPSAENVAWAHYRLGSALLNLSRVEEGIEAFQRAAKARAALNLEGEPYATQTKAALKLQHLDLRRALVLFDEVAASIKPKTDVLRSLKGNALMCAARIRCLDLDEFDLALRDLAIAKPLLQQFFEDSEGYASALALEAHCYLQKNDAEAAARCQAERTAFLADRPHLLGGQVQRQLAGESASRPDELVAGRVALMQGIESLDKLTGADFLDKVEQLAAETLDPDDDERGFAAGMVLSFAGDRLVAEGKKERALEYYLRAVNVHPASFEHREELAVCLLNLGRFQEAVEVGLRLAIDNPASHVGSLICGVAGYRSGDYALADQMLHETLRRKPDQAVAKDLLEKTDLERLKLTLEGNPLPRALTRTFSPTTHRAFLDYLRDFAKRATLNADSFWKKRSEDKLVQNPENAGRALLAQDIAAVCRGAAIYKETILAGGRIDLILNVLGSEFVLELKMCGAGYPRDWAESGFEQLKQYMQARGATRSYLVVFDARASQEGDDALPSHVELGDGLVAFCVAINIRGMTK